MAFVPALLQKPPFLVVLLDLERLQAPITQWLPSIAQACPHWIQIRAPKASLLEIKQFCLQVQKEVAGKIPLVLNSHWELALELGLEGVHFPETFRDLSTIQQNFPTSWIVGKSVHSVSSACLAKKEGYHYLQVGTMFETTCKTGKKVLEGPRLLQKILASFGTNPLPLIGVGGIHPNNAHSIVAKGGMGVCVASYITDSMDPFLATQEMLKALHQKGGGKRC